MSGGPASAPLWHDEAVAALVHELRTPVTTIRALSELILDAPDMDADEQRGFLSIIAAESLRLGRLVDDILDAARLGSDEAEIAREDLDPAALVAEAARIASALMIEKGAQLALDLPPAAPMVRGDRDRLLQVLLNLLSNAAKMVPAQGGRITVSLEAGPEAVIRVRDNGPGIPPGQHEAVFQPFRRLGPQGTRPPGTGLGLPISRRIVEGHGGTLGVEPAEGACFVIRLPVPPTEGSA